MPNKELRRLRKTERMELLVDQMKQNEWQQKKLEGQETDLKQIDTRLNDVFTAAQSAADEYLENSTRLESETRSSAETLLENSRTKASGNGSKRSETSANDGNRQPIREDD